MSIDTSKLNRYKPGYVHSNDGPGYISMIARDDGEYVRLEDVKAITSALEQALTKQRGDDVESAARALFEAQADPLAASWDRQWGPTKELWRKVARGNLYATTPKPSADAVRELVKRWRGSGKAIAHICADELESLLSAASDHQQNAAQGGGD